MNLRAAERFCEIFPKHSFPRFWPKPDHKISGRNCARCAPVVKLSKMSLSGFSWFYMNSFFSQKMKNHIFFSKMQKRKEMSKIYQKILQKYLKISDFGGKPAPKITWRKGAGCTPLVKRQKLTFPEIPCFCGKSQNYHKIEFSRHILENP